MSAGCDCAQTGAATAATAITNQERHTIPASVPLNPIDSESSSKDSPAREREDKLPPFYHCWGAGEGVTMLSP